MNSILMRVSLALGAVANWLYMRALTGYIKKQQKLLDKDITTSANQSTGQQRRKK